MTGVDDLAVAIRRIQLEIDQRHESRVLDGVRQRAVDVADHHRRFALDVAGHRLETRLDARRDQPGRNPFAGNVAEREAESAVGERLREIEIASYGPSRHADGGAIKAGNL
jgi:hypothetical protein